MIALDTNILVHAHRRGTLHHEQALLPAFVVGALGARWTLAAGRGLAAAALALLPVLSVAAQGVGHRREVAPPIPFRGPADFVARILTEQVYRFSRFVLSGGRLRAWHGSA